jgi:hypothetical protein
LALDLLRGTFLIEIIVAHIAWRPSFYTYISGGNQLPASAAEGFFAISGIIVGYLYGPRVLKETKKVFTKIWKRAALLWFLATFFTLFYTAWATLDPANPVYQTIYGRESWKFLIDTFTLRHAFGWADFLNRYAMFMLFAPFAVWLVAKGRAWVVVIASFVVWFFLREVDRFLPFSAWQIIFFYGIILGYYLPNIESWFHKLKMKLQRNIVVVVCSVAVTSYILSVFVFIVAPHYFTIDGSGMLLRDSLAPYFNKHYVAPARIGIGILWFTCLYILYRRYEKQISKYTRGALELLGRQSLFVFSLHALILFVIDLYLPPIPGMAVWQNTLVTTAVLLIIYIATYNRASIIEYFRALYRNQQNNNRP